MQARGQIDGGRTGRYQVRERLGFVLERLVLYPIDPQSRLGKFGIQKFAFGIGTSQDDLHSKENWTKEAI